MMLEQYLQKFTLGAFVMRKNINLLIVFASIAFALAFPVRVLASSSQQTYFPALIQTALRENMERYYYTFKDRPIKNPEQAGHYFMAWSKFHAEYISRAFQLISQLRRFGYSPWMATCPLPYSYKTNTLQGGCQPIIVLELPGPFVFLWKA